MPVLPERTGALGLAFTVDYWFTRHQSNDAYYQYTSHLVGAGIRLSY